MDRKLSDILIEIAMQGLKNPKYGHSEVMHPLMILAHIAWDRDTKSANYLEDQYQHELAKFPFTKSKISRELISDDWGGDPGKNDRIQTGSFPQRQTCDHVLCINPVGKSSCRMGPGDGVVQAQC
jgi:hypothetical protein